MSNLPQPILHISKDNVRVLACPLCGAASRSVDAYDAHYSSEHPQPSPVVGVQNNDKGLTE